MGRFNKAGQPTSPRVAEAIETLRDALFHEYGTDYAFSVLGRGHVIGASCNPDMIIHAVTRGGS